MKIKYTTLFLIHHLSPSCIYKFYSPIVLLAYLAVLSTWVIFLYKSAKLSLVSFITNDALIGDIPTL